MEQTKRALTVKQKSRGTALTTHYTQRPHTPRETAPKHAQATATLYTRETAHTSETDGSAQTPNETLLLLPGEEVTAFSQAAVTGGCLSSWGLHS